MRITQNLTRWSKLNLLALTLLPLATAGGLKLPLQGSFSVSAEASPNTTGSSFCGGSATDQIAIEAHGTGFSTLGAFTFTLHKTFNLNTGEYHGCLVLTAPSGDTLNANYKLIQSASTSDFATGSGTLTITGGTGLFKGATGTLNITGVFLSLYPANSFLGGGKAPLPVAANYTVDGAISLGGF